MITESKIEECNVTKRKIYRSRENAKFEQSKFVISTNLTSLTLTLEEAWLSLEVEADALESIAIAIKDNRNH